MLFGEIIYQPLSEQTVATFASLRRLVFQFLLQVLQKFVVGKRRLASIVEHVLQENVSYSTVVSVGNGKRERRRSD